MVVVVTSASATAAATTTPTTRVPGTTAETAEANVGLASKVAKAAEAAGNAEAEARMEAMEAGLVAAATMVAPQVCSGVVAERAWVRLGVRSARVARRSSRFGWRAMRRSAARRSRQPTRAARGTAGPAGALTWWRASEPRCQQSVLYIKS